MAPKKNREKKTKKRASIVPVKEDSQRCNIPWKTMVEQRGREKLRDQNRKRSQASRDKKKAKNNQKKGQK